MAALRSSMRKMGKYMASFSHDEIRHPLRVELEEGGLMEMLEGPLQVLRRAQKVVFSASRAGQGISDFGKKREIGLME